MSQLELPEPNTSEWQSATICPKCGHVLDLEELDLLAITTGMATCPRCGWAGYIDIQIVEKKELPSEKCSA